jgi:hypothetical protein
MPDRPCRAPGCVALYPCPIHDKAEARAAGVRCHACDGTATVSKGRGRREPCAVCGATGFIDRTRGKAHAEKPQPVDDRPVIQAARVG